MRITRKTVALGTFAAVLSSAGWLRLPSSDLALGTGGTAAFSAGRVLISQSALESPQPASTSSGSTIALDGDSVIRANHHTMIPDTGTSGFPSITTDVVVGRLFGDVRISLPAP